MTWQAEDAPERECQAESSRVKSSRTPVAEDGPEPSSVSAAPYVVRVTSYPTPIPPLAPPPTSYLSPSGTPPSPLPPTPRTSSNVAAYSCMPESPSATSDSSAAATSGGCACMHMGTYVGMHVCMYVVSATPPPPPQAGDVQCGQWSRLCSHHAQAVGSGLRA